MYPFTENTGLLLLTKLWDMASQNFSGIFPLNAEDIHFPRDKVPEEKTILPFALFCVWHQWDFQMNGVSILIRKS